MANHLEVKSALEPRQYRNYGAPLNYSLCGRNEFITPVDVSSRPWFVECITWYRLQPSLVALIMGGVCVVIRTQTLCLSCSTYPTEKETRI